MFVAQAHSFVQQARLAITLAWVAGYTNIVTIITCGEVTSHVSGTASNLGRDVAAGSWHLAGFCAFLLTTFLVGAMVSGFLTEVGRRRGWDSIYVLPMVAEALLLTGFAIGEELAVSGDRGVIAAGGVRWLLVGLASAAMGLQNATITRISGGVVRTTHVTGTLTDLGLEAAQFALWAWDRRRDYPAGSARALARSLRAHPTARRLALLATILGSFAFGAGLGTIVHARFPAQAMFPPVLFLLWIIYQDVRVPIAELAPTESGGGGGVKGEGGAGAAAMDLPPGLAVFHLRRRAGGGVGIQRMPNLLAWADRLDPITKVVVLDIGQVHGLRGDAAQELRAALRKVNGEGRRLVIAGVDAARFEDLRGAASEDLGVEDVCPDLELAIARGISLLSET